jgi:cyclohexanone monooxygenase
MATGCLSAPNLPRFEGMGSFQGATYHTGNWPHDPVDFTGQRVAVIGTGSSAIQSIPVIAGQAAQLLIFQRTPNYAVPAHNAPLSRAAQQAVKADYAGLRARARQTFSGIAWRVNDVSALEVAPETRKREYETRWERGGLSFMAAFNDLLMDEESNATAAGFVRAKIREKVRDATVARALSPSNIIGCKRLCVDIGYYETFNRANVTLIDVSEAPIEAITREGVRASGREHKVDAIVFATGFDAMTGALTKIEIRGRGGLPLREKWSAGPRAYLGLATAGFPNLFTITGPGSPSVLTNMLPSIEQHVDWIADCLIALRDKGVTVIEPMGEAEEAWVGHVGEAAGTTLRSSCSSWYVGANIPGNPRVFMPYIGGLPAYIERCEAVVQADYEGFAKA